jgi:hypothetical protein
MLCFKRNFVIIYFVAFTSVLKVMTSQVAQSVLVTRLRTVAISSDHRNCVGVSVRI